MKAIVVEKDQPARLMDFDPQDLMPGELTLRVSHSTVNYKDGLALTGGAPIIRRFPMIPGIDLAGVVENCTNTDWKIGEAVVVTGWGMGESHHGGYAQIARIPASWPVRLPEGLDAAAAMTVGTAGFTAMLCVMALERQGAKPGDGAVLVTGAAGGVGSVAVSLLAKRGWQVIASTGRPSEADYLQALGAAQIIDRSELSSPGKPLDKERWAAAVDSVGSYTLANVLSQTKRGGVVTACGLAQGMDLTTSVAPFILRSIALIGIDSVTAPASLRQQAWQNIARDLDRSHLALLSQTIALDQVIPTAAKILAGQIRGRTLVEIDN